MLTMNVRLTLILLALVIALVVFTAFYNLKMRSVFAPKTAGSCGECKGSGQPCRDSVS